MSGARPCAARPVRLLLFAALIAGGAALSAIRAANQRPGTDFHAKWMAGKFFFSGDPVYVLRPDVRGPPTYPPFAAMVFQVFALLPLKVAAGLFYFANLFLTGFALVLTRRLFRRLWPGSERRRWPFVAAVVCAGQFYLNNLNLVQIDVSLFVLVLLGISAYLDGRDVSAATAFVVAAALKLIPVFFVVWLLVRGRRRAALAVVPLAAACVALPILQRGIHRGTRDLEQYRAIVLDGVRRGQIEASYTNQNLAASIYRLTRPPQEPGDWDYRVVPASETTQRAAYAAAALLVALGLLANLVWLRARGEPLSVFEFAGVFLTGHLLSALTWKSHLVSLLFVAYAFLAIPADALPRAWRFAWAALAAVLLGIGVSGRDVVGNTVHHWIGGYSVIAWTMLLLWAGALFLSHRRFHVWEADALRGVP